MYPSPFKEVGGPRQPGTPIITRSPGHPRDSAPQHLADPSESTHAVTMIPIVIDTNVFVAALRSAGGALRAILRELLREYP